MNREAVALGVPVYTDFAGRLGGVDEQLIRDGRLRLLTDPHAIDVSKTGCSAPPERVPRETRGSCSRFFFPATGYE